MPVRQLATNAASERSASFLSSSHIYHKASKGKTTHMQWCYTSITTYLRSHQCAWLMNLFKKASTNKVYLISCYIVCIIQGYKAIAISYSVILLDTIQIL